MKAPICVLVQLGKDEISIIAFTEEVNKTENLFDSFFCDLQ